MSRGISWSETMKAFNKLEEGKREILRGRGITKAEIMAAKNKFEGGKGLNGARPDFIIIDDPGDFHFGNVPIFMEGISVRHEIPLTNAKPSKFKTLISLLKRKISSIKRFCLLIYGF